VVRAIYKCFFILLGVEFLLFVGLIATAMTDSKPPAIAGWFYWPLRYIFSFPLVLINDNYPYFLDRGGTTMQFVFLGLLNNVILACMLIGIFAIWKKLIIGRG
jgi:hypothetical protein